MRDISTAASDRLSRPIAMWLVVALYLGPSCAMIASCAQAPRGTQSSSTPSNQSQRLSVDHTRPYVQAHQEPQAPADSPFVRGYMDHRALRAWLSSVPPEYKAGATYWLSSRGAGEATCDDARGAAPALAWRQGCEDAKAHLAPIDERREIDPSYRLGWNSYRPAKRSDPAETLNNEAAPPAKASEASTDPGEKPSRATAGFPPPKGY